MTRARIGVGGGEEGDPVEVTLLRHDDETGAWVLRDDAGGVILVSQLDVHYDEVEIRCDVCGEWSDHAAPMQGGGGWRCRAGAGPCDEAESPA